MLALKRVRDHMRTLGVNAFIVGSEDAHQSEYVSDFDARRAFVSNFTGSAGTAVILQDKALLWTDGRYFLQASQELSPDWELMKSGNPGVPETEDWLVKNLEPNSIVGVDSFLYSTARAKTLQTTLKKNNIELKALEYNPVDTVWNETNSRPSAPASMVQIHPLEFAGKSREEKIALVQEELKKKDTEAVVVSMLDEIAWLFNIRGSDVDYNPVIISYAVVTLTDSYLFVDPAKLSPEVTQTLQPTQLLPYDHIEPFLKDLASQGKRVMVDPSQLNWRLYLALSSGSIPPVESPSPLTLPKALKTDQEAEGFRNAHNRDGVALTAFLHWLEDTVQASPLSLTEHQAAMRLEEFRSQMDRHVGPSFDTIAGYGPNGAIIHYKPSDTTSSPIGVEATLLLDSGAQYLDGTTDVTRTLHFGTPTPHMIHTNTLVLKGHIAIASLIFPEFTQGHRLDAVARLALWEQGLEYLHGTGHGVGSFLNVHEGPQGIGTRVRPNDPGFHAGMTCSNEPGYYEDGGFGIRIENILISREVSTPHRFCEKKFLGFENLTQVPIQRKLVDISLLTDKELAYINAYHCGVRERLLPLMREKFPQSEAYLLRETETWSK